MYQLGSASTAITAFKQKITIPGIGLVISVQDMLIMICAGANLSQSICDLIHLDPTKACAQLLAKGESWLKAQVTKAFNSLIGDVLSSVDCKRKDWKAVVSGALKFSFNEETGIAVDIDESALTQDLICALAQKTVSVALSQPIHVVMRALQNACATATGTKVQTALPTNQGLVTSAPPPSTASSTTTTTVLTPDQLKKLIAANAAPPSIAIWHSDTTTQPSKIPLYLALTAGAATIFAGGWWFFGRRKSR